MRRDAPGTATPALRRRRRVRHAPRAQGLRAGGLHTCWLDAHGLVVPDGIVLHDAVAPLQGVL
ncbi:hypothetical protein KHF85_19480 [Xanthomonas translucens pv. graminis]|uniref:hypothetical protein n=1 Tax=Xanthomonas graminis TaxID=3390026 RepID=UPI00253F96A9|nr:hypothetical protein [Xanthomonas translucens]WIH04896.1 hypothetical protein KHF85_19480 [Xanthomonas translucens pv. graminis]